jgi:outer membrane protein OmpA-like peptidoglycan-associated protein
MPGLAAWTKSPLSLRILGACAVASFLFFGCAAKQPKPVARTPDTIVLLPDAQGKTGAIIVSGAGGERYLSETRQAVIVGEGSAPGQPFILPEKDVAALAGPALRALPPPPIQFILYFEHGTANLTRGSRALLPKVMKAIKERSPVDISVVGHTDTVGDRPYNYRLSLKRAQAVAALLTSEGLDPSILEIASHGKDNPLIPTGDQVPEPRNRRVEVTVR